MSEAPGAAAQRGRAPLRLPAPVRVLAFAAAFGLGLALRLRGLDVKPLHYDEGVNGWFSLQLYWWNLYRYDPANYHGPLLHYANQIGFHLLGPNETTLRLATALAGALVPVALLPARRFAGDAPLCFAAVASAVAPALVYFSRTAIHEILLVLATALWAAALARFAQRPRPGPALAAGIAAALAFASKETALLSAAGLGAGAALAWLAGRPGPALGAGLADLFGGRSRRAALRAWTREARGAWLAGALAFVAVIALFYSSLLTHPRGLVDFVAAYANWAEYGISGRDQARPAGYFLGVMAASEGAWRWLALPAAALAVATRERLGLALLGWAAASLLTYSAIPYKTPWCVLEIDLPVLLLVAWAAGRAAQAAAERARPAPLRALAAAAALAGLAPAPFLLAETLADNRARFDDFRRPFAYHQTFAEFHELLRDLFGVRDAVPAAEALRIVSVDLEFPLSFYLLTRGWPLSQLHFAQAPPEASVLDAADLVLASERYQDAVATRLAARGRAWQRQRYFYRPGTYAHAWYREPHWERFQAAGGRAASPWPRPPRRPLPAPADGP